MEMLFCEKENYHCLTDAGQKLIDNRHMFLTQHIAKRFGGYASGQTKQMVEKNKTNAGRQELVVKYRYDTKYAMHAKRLLEQAIEIMKTCDFKTKRPNTNELLAVKNGRYTITEITKHLNELNAELQSAKKETKLPETADIKAVNALLINITHDYLKEKDYI